MWRRGLHHLWREQVIEQLVRLYSISNGIQELETIALETGARLDHAFADGTYSARIRRLVVYVDEQRRLSHLVERIHSLRPDCVTRSPDEVSEIFYRLAAESSPDDFAALCDRERQWAAVKPLLDNGGFRTIIVPGPSEEGHEFFVRRIQTAFALRDPPGTQPNYEIDADCVRAVAAPLERHHCTTVDSLAIELADDVSERAVICLAPAIHYRPTEESRYLKWYTGFLPALFREIESRRTTRRLGSGLIVVQCFVYDRAPERLRKARGFFRSVTKECNRVCPQRGLHVLDSLRRIPTREALELAARSGIALDPSTRRAIAEAEVSRDMLCQLEIAAKRPPTKGGV